jgi:hypothetical protein
MCHRHQYIDWTTPDNRFKYEIIVCARLDKEWPEICLNDCPTYSLSGGKECPKGCLRDKRTTHEFLFPKEAEKKSEGVDRTTKGKRKRDSSCCMC